MVHTEELFEYGHKSSGQNISCLEVLLKRYIWKGKKLRLSMYKIKCIKHV